MDFLAWLDMLLKHVDGDLAQPLATKRASEVMDRRLRRDSKHLRQ